MCPGSWTMKEWATFKKSGTLFRPSLSATTLSSLTKDLLGIPQWSLVRLATDDDDAGRAAGAGHAGDDGVAEDEVAEVAGAELALETVGGGAVRAGHDAGVEDERVDDGAGGLHPAMVEAATRTEARELRSTRTERMGRVGWVAWMAAVVAERDSWVREARMRRAGECCAIVSAKCEPRLLGVTPVMRMVLPRMLAERSAATSVAVVSKP